MQSREKGTIRRLLDQVLSETRMGLSVMRARGPSQIQFWFLALGIGIVSGGAALGFRLGISALQRQLYGTDDVYLASFAERLPWWWVPPADRESTISRSGSPA